jgi:FMN-dependent NADH-azoreductase
MNEAVLLINACARPESRTLPLARRAAARLSAAPQTLDLYGQRLVPLDCAALTKRERLIAAGDYSDESFRFAKQFRAADGIVIAAPYWDLSFPSVLKCYIETVCVNGLTFRYNEMGVPVGLCAAKRLVYVTTAGGFIPERDFGFDYIRQLCTDYFGIPETVRIKAEGLDIFGADVEGILRRAEEEIDRLAGGAGCS